MSNVFVGDRIHRIHSTYDKFLYLQVFIGECVSARVSYLELNIDDMKTIKQKCSGLIASTGLLVWFTFFYYEYYRHSTHFNRYLQSKCYYKYT